MELTLDQALQSGIEAHKAGQIQDAERFYIAILKTQPKHPHANHNMGVLAVGVGKIQEALPFFRAALEANPNESQFWLSYIDALIRLNLVVDAKAMLDQAKKKGANGLAFDQFEQQLARQRSKINSINAIESAGSNSSNPNILDTVNLDRALRLAKQRLKDGQIAESKNIYDSILQKFPKNKKALIALKSLAESSSLVPQDPPSAKLQPIINLYSQGQLQQTLCQASEMLKQFPNSSILYDISGVANARLKQFDAALENYSKAIKINPQSAEIYNNRGIALDQIGQLDEAIESYEQALTINPDYAEALSNMGLALKGKGDLESAMVKFKQAIKINPTDANTYHNIGMTLNDMGADEAAITSFKQAIEINPNFSEAYFSMANSLRYQGNFEVAILNYKHALKIKPDFAEAYNNMGSVFKTNRHYREAKECFDKIKSSEAIAQSLECSYHLKNYKEFNKTLKSIAVQDPANIRVAALSAFAAHQTKQTDVFPFCRNPIELIKISNINKHVPNACDFIKTVLDEMNSKDALWEPKDNTTKGGFRTNGNLFSNPSEIIKLLETIIQKELDLFYSEFKRHDNHLIRSWPEKNGLTGWYNRILKNGHHDSHIHPSGWVSGVFYLKTVEVPAQNEGAIEFGLHGYNYPVKNEKYPRRIYQPCNGDLILFPSSLFHKTIPVIKDTERCVIAFDMLLK